VPLTPGTPAVPYMGTPESEDPVPAPASVVVLLCAALVGLRRKR
jgi:hypothetical protein